MSVILPYILEPREQLEAIWKCGGTKTPMKNIGWPLVGDIKKENIVGIEGKEDLYDMRWMMLLMLVSRSETKKGFFALLFAFESLADGT